ncbi:MAG: hypothetical protein JRJ03_14730 [Deltaproteobacteria bacterium]|nr:hypothetical protein [Deltaproteobacteria bacterium]
MTGKEEIFHAFSLLLFAALVSMQFLPCTSWCFQNNPDNSPPQSVGDQQPSEPWYERIRLEWGGHLKFRGTASWPDEESIYGVVGTGTYYDATAEARLKGSMFLGDWGYMEAHYEAIFSGGDTRSKVRELERMFPELFNQGLMGGRTVEDDTRFTDLTKIIDEHDDYVIYDRLDRLSLTLLADWGLVRIGRQAVTWGNGLVFNPMDMFNPFAPTDTERDYKIGDDMLLVQITALDVGELELLVVPRRNPVSGEVEGDESSVAGKLHFAKDTLEFDIMAGKDYEDTVVGFGGSGYLREAAWRMDVIWTRLDDDQRKDFFLSIVANMDYSWLWWEKNVYGLVELYYNGLGQDDYREAIKDPNISERIRRGELFALGRLYLSGHLRMELHPLLNAYFTIINNVKDPSGILQPYVTWDIKNDVQLTVGGTFYYGGDGTEYGGFDLDGSGVRIEPPPNAYARFTHFF